MQRCTKSAPNGSQMHMQVCSTFLIQSAAKLRPMCAQSPLRLSTWYGVQEQDQQSHGLQPGPCPDGERKGGCSDFLGFLSSLSVLQQSLQHHLRGRQEDVMMAAGVIGGEVCACNGKTSDVNEPRMRQELPYNFLTSLLGISGNISMSLLTTASLFARATRSTSLT